ncbi:MAG: hypothetical protein H0X12_02685 [Nocardioides sp.]|nr:hypothetical protein [Nocardioides sp.]
MKTNHRPLGSPDDDRPDDRPSDELADCAHQAESAIERLAHLSSNRPSLTPAEVDVVLAYLAYLAETVAALPRLQASSAASSTDPETPTCS